MERTSERLREKRSGGTTMSRGRRGGGGDELGCGALLAVVWIVYLVTDNHLLAWIAFVDLLLIALLGSLLVRIWTKDGRAAMAGTKAEVDLAEQHIPRPPVVLHGVFAISTIVLVFFAALGVGPGA